LGVRVLLPLCRGGVQLVVVRSGSLAFPASSSTFRFPGGPRGLPSAVVTMVAHRPALSVFASPTVPSSRNGLVEPAFLSWDSLRPSVDIPPSVHSRSRSEDRLHRLPVATPEVPFRPRGFRTTSTVCSARSSRACCIPLSTLGFAAFPRSAWMIVRPKPNHPCGYSFPRRTHPGEPPRRQPYRVTAAAASLPLLSRSHRLRRGCARNLILPD
jgi:hypothetical protein